MSTFGGVMREFPDIRVDYFRPVLGAQLPLACFLSHVHSDHLNGLESFKSPFVYCSAATREILIRLERNQQRINFEKGILESRIQHFKHLKKVLRPIPLETPTTIELSPGNEIQVTLFDANHCIGAVMFLFESKNAAVLYTGDIRSEPWFVNNLRRNPYLLEYTSEIKSLDCIYLDTSFTDDVWFPTKAEGLSELLRKVSKYPSETVFHLAAWTFGYEDVWLALSKALDSKVHVDDYKFRIHQSLTHSGDGLSSDAYLIKEGPALAGFKFGNQRQEGILTQDQRVRLHSCGKEMGCRCYEPGNNTVWIRPIITRIGGTEICEAGIGGGGEDLANQTGLAIENDTVIRRLMSYLIKSSDSEKHEIQQKLTTILQDRSFKTLDISSDRDETSLEDLITALVESVAREHKDETSNAEVNQCDPLPKVITFPYSRHSSYSELCDLVKAFQPLDVYPCTVDEDSWHEGKGMQLLFGSFCNGKIFHHDHAMRTKLQALQSPEQDSQSMSGSDYITDLSDSDDLVGSKRKESSSNIKPQDGIVVEGVSEEKTAQKSLTQPIETPNLQSNGTRRKASFTIDSDRKRIRLSQDVDEVSSPSGGGDRSLVPDVDREGSDVDQSNLMYWDANDEVFRCRTCSWEVWTSSSGFCTNCDKGEPSYYEILDPDNGNRVSTYIDEIVPAFVPDEICDYSDVASDFQEHVGGDYLDLLSSAYETDSEDGMADMYERNSFIDDASLPDISGEKSQIASSVDSDEEDTDYKALYLTETAIVSNLMDELEELQDRYDNIRYITGIGSDYDDDFDEDFDEDPSDAVFVPLVEVQVRDPPLSEVVLSFQGDSQASVLSIGRENARFDASKAALDTRGQGWHSISLISTGDNHSTEEVEL